MNSIRQTLSTVALSVLVVSALAFCVPPALAEPVLLKVGKEVGVGWLFLDADGRCRVVTPRHVIAAQDDPHRLVPPDLLERNGRTTATRNPVPAADPQVDLAFLEASPIVAEDGCSSSRLTARSLNALLDSMDTGILSMITETDQQTIRVVAQAASIDKFGGGVIAIVPVAGEENLKMGMSGSILLANGEPLAMLFWVEPDGVGLAYRFDAIAAYKAAVASGVEDVGATPGLVQDIALVDGRLGAGSLQALIGGGGLSEFLYQRRRVVLIVDLKEATLVRGVRIDAPPGRALGGEQIVVETAPESGPFGYVRSCEGFADAPRLICQFAPRQAARLRLTFVQRADATATPVVLGSLGVLGN